MSTRIFGIIVFGSNSSVVYRFLTDGLSTYFRQAFDGRGYKINDNFQDDDTGNDHIEFMSFDDALSLHCGTLLRVLDQTKSRSDPIRRISLQSGIQVFFDQIEESKVLCMADKSFDTIIVLKTINLLKALVTFHIGALPFIPYNANGALIERISASLQYFLNNIATNQSLLFESCEYLHLNNMIREKCREICLKISSDVQTLLGVSRKVILITCDDKIVYSYWSSDECRPSNADIFLLSLNNTSRLHRKTFETQVNRSKVMGHRYDHSKVHSARSSVDNSRRAHAQRTNSMPIFSMDDVNTTTSPENTRPTYRSEVVFLRIPNRTIAPFNLFTIPLTEGISALILVQWENSDICLTLYELIRLFDSDVNHQRLSYKKIDPLVKTVENSILVRKYFENDGGSGNVLSETLDKANRLVKSSMRRDLKENEKERIGSQVNRLLGEMSRLAVEIFRHLFFDSAEYARQNGFGAAKQLTDDIQMEGIGLPEADERKNEYNISSLARKLQASFIFSLEDWFSFIEVKAQRNITMNFCHDEFPGLVHFVFINRQRGSIYAPALIMDEHQLQPSTDDLEHQLEKRILAFQLECFSALQQGFTSYSMTDEYFVYNYALSLRENNGASMRLYKSIILSHAPSILHLDFYRSLAAENYPSLAGKASMYCSELISVHLRVVPPRVVHEQLEQLWTKLMDFDE